MLVDLRQTIVSFREVGSQPNASLRFSKRFRPAIQPAIHFLQLAVRRRVFGQHAACPRRRSLSGKSAHRSSTAFSLRPDARPHTDRSSPERLDPAPGPDPSECRPSTAAPFRATARDSQRAERSARLLHPSPRNALPTRVRAALATNSDSSPRLVAERPWRHRNFCAAETLPRAKGGISPPSAPGPPRLDNFAPLPDCRPSLLECLRANPPPRRCRRWLCISPQSPERPPVCPPGIAREPD